MSNPDRTAAGTPRKAARNDAPLHRARARPRRTRAPPIALLRDWRNAHPDALSREGFRSAEEDQALAEHEELAAEVTTAGETWRAGFHIGLDHAATIHLRRGPVQPAPTGRTAGPRGLLDYLRKPFCGSGGSAIAAEKILCKQSMEGLGVLTPAWQAWKSGEAARWEGRPVNGQTGAGVRGASA